MTSLNRMLANKRDIREDELDQVAGGTGSTTFSQVRSEWCYSDGSCNWGTPFTTSDDSTFDG